MYVIAFLGSPRKGGNTEILLKEAIRGTGAEVEPFNLTKLNIKPCRHCGKCEATGICAIKDDMIKIADALRKADRIILASPVFFSGVSAQAKAMIDRCQQFWCEKYLLKRPLPAGEYGRKGLFIAVGGQKKEEGIRCSEATASAFFRTISVDDFKTLGYTGVDGKGEIVKHPTALKDAFEAGRELIII